MTFFQYDGTFRGFLTALFEALAARTPPGDISSCASRQPGLCAARTVVKTDEEKVLRIGGILEEKIGGGIIQNVLYAFLSDVPQREMMIYRYCAFGIEVGNRLDAFLADERVIRVHRLISRVEKEAHRYLGLVRFQELQDHTLYAPIEPDHYILPMIAGHFRRRLPRETWIIHDHRRGKAAVSSPGGLLLADIAARDKIILSPAETEMQGTWKGYVKHLAIEERLNPGLQRQHIPLRYWTHLTEMQSGRRTSFVGEVG